MGSHGMIDKYISIMKRWSNPFFDKRMADYGIGSGQKFFLLQISRNPGISFQELAWRGGYDKATSTRAVKKLTEAGYVRQETDGADKRIRHLYVTEEAEPVLKKTRESLEAWVDLITEGFTEEEKNQAEQLLARMASNACVDAVKEYKNQGE